MGTFITSSTPTLNGDGSVTSDGTDRIQCPEARTVLNENQGWVAAMVKPSWASGGALPGTTPWMFEWGDAAFDHRLTLRWGTAGAIEFQRDVAADSGYLAIFSSAFAANDLVLCVGAWDAANIYGSAHGDAFTSAASATIPTISSTSFELCNFLGGDRPLLVPMYWFACGRGTITNSDVTTLNNLGTTDPGFTTLGSSAQTTMIASFNTFDYSTSSAMVVLPQWPRVHFNG